MANHDNLLKCMAPSGFTVVKADIPSQMKMPIINEYNPLRESIMLCKPNDTKHGGFYHLPNIQKERGEPDFCDIWLLTDEINNEKQRNMI